MQEIVREEDDDDDDDDPPSNPFAFLLTCQSAYGMFFGRNFQKLVNFLFPFKKLGSFKNLIVERKIGGGGFGTTYLCSWFGRPCCLKVFEYGDGSLRSKISDASWNIKARALDDVKDYAADFNVQQMVDWGFCDRHLLILSRSYDGFNLEYWIKFSVQQRWSTEKKEKIYKSVAFQILNGLTMLNLHGFVHRFVFFLTFCSQNPKNGTVFQKNFFLTLISQ